MLLSYFIINDLQLIGDCGSRSSSRHWGGNGAIGPQGTTEPSEAKITGSPVGENVPVARAAAPSLALPAGSPGSPARTDKAAIAISSIQIFFFPLDNCRMQAREFFFDT